MTSATMPTPSQALDMYRSVVEQFDQAHPMAVVGLANGDVAMGEMSSEEGLSMAQTLAVSLAFIVAQAKAAADWVVFSSEAWHKVTESPSESYPHGELERRAKAGDESVNEVVIIVGASQDGEMWMSTTPFTRLSTFPPGNGVRRVRWFPSEVHYGTEVQGQVADVLRVMLAETPEEE